MRYKAKRRRGPKRRLNIASWKQVAAQPDVQWIKLRYSSYHKLVPALGSYVAGHRFRGNGPRDPDETGIGNFITGWTTMTDKYAEYYCPASKISIEYVNNSTQPTNLTVFPNREVISATMIANENFIPEENPYGWKNKLLGSSSGGANRWKTSMYMNTAKMFGQSRPGYDTGLYGAATGAEPVRQWYWHVFATDASADIDVTNVEGIVTITYYVKFSNMRWQSRAQ